MRHLELAVIFSFAAACGGGSHSTDCDQYKTVLARHALCDPEFTPPTISGKYNAYRCVEDAGNGDSGTNLTLAQCTTYLNSLLTDAGCQIPLGSERSKCKWGLLELSDQGAHISSDGVGDHCKVSTVPATGFDPSETFVEMNNSMCKTARCLLHGANPDKDAYCSCRCDAAGENVATCTCPEGFVCEDTLHIGSPGVIGSYCQRK